MRGKEFAVQHPGSEHQMRQVLRDILAKLPLEERLACLSPEERLAGLSPQERLCGLSPEQLERLRLLLQQPAPGEGQAPSPDKG
jgi:hypothetical protein